MIQVKTGSSSDLRFGGAAGGYLGPVAPGRFDELDRSAVRSGVVVGVVGAVAVGRHPPARAQAYGARAEPGGARAGLQRSGRGAFAPGDRDPALPGAVDDQPGSGAMEGVPGTGRRYPMGRRGAVRCAASAASWLAFRACAKQCREVAPQLVARAGCGWLGCRFPDEEQQRVSHETIYRSLYIRARGVLKKELLAHLRAKRTIRRSRRASLKRDGLGQFKDAVSISERPAEAEDHAVPGLWERDQLGCARQPCRDVGRAPVALRDPRQGRQQADRHRRWRSRHRQDMAEYRRGLKTQRLGRGVRLYRGSVGLPRRCATRSY